MPEAHSVDKILLIELNELNIDVVRDYVSQGFHLPNFKKLLSLGFVRTTAEDEYELLEPWIQWPSVHTGKSYKDHGVFRLGDMAHADEEQLFELIEERGYSVGCISPMNAKNNLKTPAFFIPDPWTDTPSDGSTVSALLTTAICRLVNENAQSKLSFRSISSLIVAVLMTFSLIELFSLTRRALVSWRKRWTRAIFLDVLLFRTFAKWLRRKQPDFAVLFLNAGAHIQHHYMHSSHVMKISDGKKNPEWYVSGLDDPLFDLLKAYDEIVGELLNDQTYRFVIATGLTQRPYEKPEFYYRLKDHEKFVSKLGISYSSIMPRMSRDFLIAFNSNLDRDDAVSKLKKVQISGTPIFKNIDVREAEIFVTLEHPDEILETFRIAADGDLGPASEHVALVAIKNGEHHTDGFLFKSQALTDDRYLIDNDHVKNIFDYILSLFPRRSNPST